MKKKMMSLALALVMFVSLITPSVAAEKANGSHENIQQVLEDNNFNIPDNNIFSSILDAPTAPVTTRQSDSSYAYNLDSNSIMVAEDQANGDALFTLIQNGEIISSSYLNRNANTIVYTNFKTDTVTTTQLPPRSSIINDTASIAARVSYSYQGRIRYQYTSGTTKLCGANIYANFYTNPGERYDLNGTYRDVTNFAAYICGVLAVPVAFGSKIAGGILTALGIALGTASYFIPKEPLINSPSL